jgi:2-dehydropantoate 2-reductase
MRVLVAGAGIQGSFLAAELHRAGVDVILLGRGKRLSDIRKDGVRLSYYPSPEISVTHLPVISDISQQAPYDVILVTMQKQQAIAINRTVGKHGDRAVVTYLGNNGTGIADYREFLPPERIVLGFLGIGGVRADDYMQLLVPRPVRVYLGATSSQRTHNLEKVISLLESAQFRVEIPSSIDAWLKCHLAMILPLAGAIYAADCDNYRLARTPGLLRLIVRSLRESFAVLSELHYPILAKKLSIMTRIPEWLILPLLKKRLATKEAEIGLSGHAKAARAELQHLAGEFKIMIQHAKIPTPNLDYLTRFSDPMVPPVDEGVDHISLDGETS